MIASFLMGKVLQKLIIASGLRKKINFEIFNSDKHEFNSNYVSGLIYDSFLR